MAENNAWLSMTSAPNSGKPILLKLKNGAVYVGAYIAGQWRTLCCATVITPGSWKEI